jgi:hypothetical protein
MGPCTGLSLSLWGLKISNLIELELIQVRSPSIYAVYPTFQSTNALMNGQSGPTGPSVNPQGASAPSNMPVDVPTKWSTDPTIFAVTHGKGCDTCKGYRRHIFEALCDEDEGFLRALEANKKHWVEEADVHLKMEKGRYNALYDEYCELRKMATTEYDELQDCKDDLRKRKNEVEDAEDEIEFLKKKVGDLEAKIALVGEEERAQYQALASKGKQRETPSDVAEPMAKHIQTMSLEADETMPFIEHFPDLPKPSPVPTLVNHSLRPSSGSRILPAGPSAIASTPWPSVAPSGSRFPPAGPSASILGTSMPKPGPSATIFRGRICTFDSIKMIMEKAHNGRPGGMPDMAAVLYVQHTVSKAHAWQRNGEPVDEIQDYVLRNWRVPPGIEKSTKRVERMLGIPASGANKRKFSSRGHPNQPGPSTIAGELPYEPVPSGTDGNCAHPGGPGASHAFLDDAQLTSGSCRGACA